MSTLGLNKVKICRNKYNLEVNLCSILNTVMQLDWSIR